MSVVFRNIPGKLPLGLRILKARGIGAAVGRLTPAVGFVMTTADSWMMIYQSMIDLQTAPLYINKTTGLPYYGEDYVNLDNPYDSGYPFW